MIEEQILKRKKIVITITSRFFFSGASDWTVLHIESDQSKLIRIIETMT